MSAPLPQPAWEKPPTWTKYGEIFHDEQKGSVYVCSPCLRSQDAATAELQRFVSAGTFWAHIQTHHLTASAASAKVISAGAFAADRRNPKRPPTTTPMLTEEGVSPKKQKLHNVIVIDTTDDENEDEDDNNEKDNAIYAIDKKKPQPEEEKEKGHPKVKSAILKLKNEQSMEEDLNCKVTFASTNKIFHGDIIDLDDDDDEDTQIFQNKNQSFTEDLYKMKLKEANEQNIKTQQCEKASRNSEAQKTEIAQEINEPDMAYCNLKLEYKEPLKAVVAVVAQEDSEKGMQNWTPAGEERRHENSPHTIETYDDEPRTEHWSLENKVYHRSCETNPEEHSRIQSTELEAQPSTSELQGPKHDESSNTKKSEELLNDVQDQDHECVGDKNDDLFCIAGERSVDEYHNVYFDYRDLSNDEDEDDSIISTVESDKQYLGSTAKTIAYKKIIYSCECAECGASFSSGSELTIHQNMHKDEKDKTTTLLSIPTPEASPNDIMTYTPPPASTPAALTNDGSTAARNTPNETAASSTLAPPFKCNLCPERYWNTLQLDGHQKVHKKQAAAAANRPFQCPFCGKRTKTEYKMQMHQKKFHSGLPDKNIAECEVCHKRILKQSLAYHMKLHADLGSFWCQLCQRSFRQRYSWALHNKKYHPKEAAPQRLAPQRLAPAPTLPSRYSLVQNSAAYSHAMPSTSQTPPLPASWNPCVQNTAAHLHEMPSTLSTLPAQYPNFQNTGAHSHEMQMSSTSTLSAPPVVENTPAHSHEMPSTLSTLPAQYPNFQNTGAHSHEMQMSSTSTLSAPPFVQNTPANSHEMPSTLSTLPAQYPNFQNTGAHSHEMQMSSTSTLSAPPFVQNTPANSHEMPSTLSTLPTQYPNLQNTGAHSHEMQMSSTSTLSASPFIQNTSAHSHEMPSTSTLPTSWHPFLQNTAANLQEMPPTSTLSTPPARYPFAQNTPAHSHEMLKSLLTLPAQYPIFQNTGAHSHEMPLTSTSAPWQPFLQNTAAHEMSSTTQPLLSPEENAVMFRFFECLEKGFPNNNFHARSNFTETKSLQ